MVKINHIWQSFQLGKDWDGGRPPKSPIPLACQRNKQHGCSKGNQDPSRKFSTSNTAMVLVVSSACPTPLCSCVGCPLTSPSGPVPAGEGRTEGCSCRHHFCLSHKETWSPDPAAPPSLSCESTVLQSACQALNSPKKSWTRVLLGDKPVLFQRDETYPEKPLLSWHVAIKGKKNREREVSLT